MSQEKGKGIEQHDVSRIDRGLMERWVWCAVRGCFHADVRNSYAELGRQAIGSTHTDLTADKHGGPLKENRSGPQEEERDDALGLRLDLNLVSIWGAEERVRSANTC